NLRMERLFLSGWARRHVDHFRALSRVTRMAEIADADQFAALPLQQDEIGRPRPRLTWVVDQNRRPPLDLAGDEAPIVDRRIIGEIVVYLAAAHSRARDQLEPHVLG